MSLLEPPHTTARQAQFNALADELASGNRDHADAHDRAGTLPTEGFAALKASPYPALTLPQRHGGAGANLLEFVTAHSRLSRGDAAVALAAAMNAHVIGSAGESGSWGEPILERIGGDIARRGALVNAIASEPELGSPSRGAHFRTVAHKVEGGWEISGRKTWATGGDAIGWFVVHAALEGKNLAVGSGKLLVNPKSPGFRFEATWVDALALRSSGAHDAVLDNVFVPDGLFVPPDGPPAEPTGSAWFWSAMSATYLGVGIAALEACTRYALERAPTALGQPIASLEGVQRRIGEIELELFAAQTALFETASRWVGAPEARASMLPLVAGAKLLCTNAAVRASDLALRVSGGAALTRATALERHFRDARAGLAHPPHDDATLTMIGQQRLEVSREPQLERTSEPQRTGEPNLDTTAAPPERSP